MNDADLLAHLTDLETRLHRNEIRRDAAAPASLLHPDFEEIGRSGRTWTRAEMLQEFETEAPLPTVAAEDFRLHRLGDGMALLTYRTAHVARDGARDRQTLRSSIWVRTDDGWQVRFHQGTPAAGGG